MSLLASKLATFACGLAFAAAPALADPASIQTPAPVIHLADNLDEKDRLGWCIDTVGRGLSDKLHAHSCKPQGGDVQFAFDTESGQITSVAFDGKCMELVAPEDPSVAFGLLDCTDDNPKQLFAINEGTGQIHPADQSDKCVAVGNASRSAGPFMSRGLILSDCGATPTELTTWVIAAP